MKPRHALLLILGAAQTGFANDFPTRARVEFVLNCMRESKAPQQESMYKCSCAIDAIADKVDYATWVELSTIANATTIAGERGGVVRDLPDGRKSISTYRELQESARKRCFLPVSSRSSIGAPTWSPWPPASRASLGEKSLPRGVRRRDLLELGEVSSPCRGVLVEPI